MNTSPESKTISLDHLQARARMLAQVRAFFAKRHVLEVDTPILSHHAPIDTHIEVMTIQFGNGERGYLHTSPEYAIKRLLADHPIDVYQLCHVFREGEASDRHNPEFTMLEWYRIGLSLEQLIDETLHLIELFLGKVKPIFLSYRDLFLQFLQIDPFQTTPEDLRQKAISLAISLPDSSSSWDLDTWLHYYMGLFIEPRLSGLYVIDAFPATQAALARLRLENTTWVADRFEIFYNGIELANGFHELTDPIEQKRRLEKSNFERQLVGKDPLPIDHYLLSALEKGLPDCCGVAAGFDRLLMLRQNSSSIKEVVPFSWDQV